MACTPLLQVVDETDRMLRQSYQDWLPNLTAALDQQQRPLHDRVVKVVVSATLTRDPSKVERLGLHCPRYIAMSSQDHRSAYWLSLLHAAASHCCLLHAADWCPCMHANSRLRSDCWTSVQACLAFVQHTATMLAWTIV